MQGVGCGVWGAGCRTLATPASTRRCHFGLRSCEAGSLVEPPHVASAHSESILRSVAGLYTGVSLDSLTSAVAYVLSEYLPIR